MQGDSEIRRWWSASWAYDIFEDLDFLTVDELKKLIIFEHFDEGLDALSGVLLFVWDLTRPKNQHFQEKIIFGNFPGYVRKVKKNAELQKWHTDA